MAGALRQYKSVSLNQQTHLERLSTGLRINRGSDDAAGLQISSRLTSQSNEQLTSIPHPPLPAF
ncbi:hypothetical protein IOC57_25115 [Bacillus sp. SD075]|nr:hypothetical protein [Bacillus sp. SD075]HER2169429.1 hypothetical protein [Streptococcus pyogenes]